MIQNSQDWRAATLTDDERVRLIKIEEWFNHHREEFIADLLQWISFASVSDDSAAVPNAPFGVQVAQLFDHVLEQGQGLGFEAQNHEGYAISILSEAAPLNEEIGLVSHLDVVPAGDNWIFEPFKPFFRDGFVIGRGASDNKGPALLDLYLLRAFRDLDIKLNRRLRIIYGGAEETGMADMEYYVKNGPIPRFSLITDGGFPVNYAQKGGLNLIVYLPTGNQLANFQAGVAENAIPATASLVLNIKDLAQVEKAIDQIPYFLREKTTLHQEGRGHVTIVAHGQSGHAAFPEKNTLNAIALLMHILLEAKLLDGADRHAAEIIWQIAQDPWGEGAGIKIEDEQTGVLTINAGLSRPTTGGINLYLDIRYPISANSENIKQKIATLVAPLGGSVSVSKDSSPFHLDRDGALVQRLQDVFNTVSESQTQAFAMGGGTHARILPRSITFGPGFGRQPNILFQGHKVSARPDFIPEDHGQPHGPDEYVLIENLCHALKIYAIALPRLDRWLDEGIDEHV